jgi:hypothetical protein
MASLPMLAFGAKPLVSAKKFIEMCISFVPEEDTAAVEAALGGYPHRYAAGERTLKAWADFETSLRNELVGLRAVRRKADPARYTKPDGGFDLEIHIAAINAVRSPFPLESERTLDAARWKKLDDLTVGHFFDVDALIVYALKLAILEKWDRIGRAEGKKELELALA